MPRDLRALELVALAQPVTTSQLARYLGMSLPMARRRVRALRDLALVNVAAPRLDAENNVLLAKRGRRLLVEERGFDMDAIAVMRGISKIHLAHHAAGVSFFVGLTNACERSTKVSLARFAFEAELRRLAGGSPEVQVPDAVAVVQGRGERLALAIEIDMGSENPSFVVTRKAHPYARMHACGAPLLGEACWVVAFVVTSERRRNRLVSAFHEAAVPEGILYLAVGPGLDEQTLLTDGWWTTRTSPDGEHARLVEESPFAPVLTDRSDRRHGQAPADLMGSAGLPGRGVRG